MVETDEKKKNPLFDDDSDGDDCKYSFKGQRSVIGFLFESIQISLEEMEQQIRETKNSKMKSLMIVMMEMARHLTLMRKTSTCRALLAKLLLQLQFNIQI